MRAFRGTPHSVTGETAIFIMMGRELRLPDQLSNSVHQLPMSVVPYIQDLVGQLKEAHEILREQQMKIREEDLEEPPLFSEGDLVRLVNKRRRKGENPKLQPKYVGPYTILQSFANHTYRLERQGQASIQNECRLKPYFPCPVAVGQAPGSREAIRRPNMKGALTREKAQRTEATELTPMLEH